ncbi:N-acetylmuramoyl-L-alanine amidase [hydrothermal vent metagenome]|uniref:N-acetylmuramoyl-L-alanine amidase n=1 Tax=hydrothermal vent metagenome TaxID=652676 RepID=A0A3B1D7U3_9ZZZZ
MEVLQTVFMKFSHIERTFKMFFDLNKITSCLLIGAILLFGVFTEAEGRESRAQSVEGLYQKAQKSYYSLKSSRKKQAYRHHWMATINKFVAVYENYPSSSYAYKALFNVARLYHQLHGVAKNSNDQERALHFYYKVISEFKAGRLTDDSLFYQGKINFDRKNYSEALGSFENILQNFPRGDQVAKAKKFKQATAPFVKTKVVKSKAIAKARAVSGKAAPVLLGRIDYNQKPDSTQVVIHTGGRAKITHNRLRNPDRVYINFLNTRLDDGVKKDIHVGGDTLERLRISQFDKTTSRLVLEVPKEIKTVISQKGGVTVVDLIAPKKQPVITAKKTAKKEIAVKPEKARFISRSKKARAVVKPVPVSISPGTKRVVRREASLIVVDPGHGGKDNGATSKRGLLEKEVNLKISKRLKKILESRYGYRVILTRTDDTFIPLEGRGGMANENSADLFVSVHVNAAKRLSAHGIETYYLGNANSEQAQETAERENGELVHSVKDNQVQQILASLISTTKINDSAILAGHVQERLHSSIKKKYSSVKNLGVKEGPFFVLHDTNMPSILVEVGFITNSREENRLRKSAYLDRLAASIARGIHEFKKDRGPTI